MPPFPGAFARDSTAAMWGTMIFWAVATAIAFTVAFAIVRAMRMTPTGSDPAAEDMAVYRDQLSEIDRDRARGVLSDDEADRVRIEVSRRLLAADRSAGERAAQTRSVSQAGPFAVVTTGGVVVLSALALYATLGAPGYHDQPLGERIAALDAARADRPSQAAAEAAMSPRPPPDVPAETRELIDRLRNAAEARPDDPEGQRLLAQYEARLGDFEAAYGAQSRLIELTGDKAGPDDHADLAELMVLAAGGYVSPEAERALEAVFARDPDHPTARYYTGLMFAQGGRDDAAFRIWRDLLEESDPGDPWVLPITQTIEGLARSAGVRYALPDRLAAPGPSAADVAAAEDMDPEARQEMIRGMVAGLSDRLATEGGPPTEWARLITALGVLGETERARAIAAEARTAFQGLDDALAEIEAAARRAGVAQ